ncbi:MAG: cell envelope integrity TolA C-terminal domain-containing protein [Pantoea sp.]|uniref:cell envelope integrity TolA C-terminal domain-containing protein n=1 Tax=unclassified Pantoea TaxID=2630326 RepID=UPI00239EAE32|nr:cell envelope integrity TolA C-terminal domain-containing protein [Pantoea sp.]MDE1189412.1 cell envelope integrity TolA C-terminal domain-containing protein [Pantoea sp.]
MNLINRMAGLLGLLTIGVVLSACQNSSSQQQDEASNVCQPDKSPTSASCKWADEMQLKLVHDFRDASHYAGQRCLVRLEWEKSGRYAVTQTQGDEPLCLRAWQLIGQSKGLPPPPDRGQPAWFGFAPQQVNLPVHLAAIDAD